MDWHYITGSSTVSQVLFLVCFDVGSQITSGVDREGEEELIYIDKLFQELVLVFAQSVNIQPINQSEWSHFFKPSDWLMAES